MKKMNAMLAVVEQSAQPRTGEIVLYQPDENTQLEVRVDDETVWLTTIQMSQLFNREDSNIRRHIIKIFSDGELPKENNVHFLHVIGVKKPVPFYNLDVIISVGYRVHSPQGIAFRQWATQIIKQYLLKGYAVNQQLLAIQRQIDTRFDEHSYRIMQIEDTQARQQQQLDFSAHAPLEFSEAKCQPSPSWANPPRISLKKYNKIPQTMKTTSNTFDGSKVFFTSDTHFNHANIIRFCNRPFKSVEEMNEIMICNWNKVVGADDTVFHLGDFCLGGAAEWTKILDRLNGKIHLIVGNHDLKNLR